jgi:dolichol-phosphate mannosyltransferase
MRRQPASPPAVAATRRSNHLISVVVPAFEETENIDEVYRRIREAMHSRADETWELIFVDDGSRDGTWPAIEAVSARDGRVKAVRLSRNFGHQYALMAGLERAGGDAVITMDCDLQHPVELLPVLLEHWRAGRRIVKTVRMDPVGLGRFKRWSSRWFYRFFSWLSGVDLRPGLADFRLLDRRVVAELKRFKEEGLFLRGIVEWVGFDSCEVSYAAEQRLHGSSKYNLRKMVRLAWHGVSSFSIMPLRIGTVVGLLGSLVSIVGVFYAFYGKFIGRGAVPGWASTLMVISVLFLLLFVYLGILGEYIGRVIIEVRRRPRFIVSETRGFDDDPGPGHP